jgi:polyhydroxyalkanoate synthesis repressor PhaR
MVAATRIIRKYLNRRLYDTEVSGYVTLDDIRLLIVDGEKFEVRDARTGEDLTRAVLLQIINEREQEGKPVLSTQLLSQIIRFYGDSMQGSVSNYLERSMQVFLDQHAQFRNQMDNLLGQTPWDVMNQVAEKNMELWQDFQHNLTSSMGQADSPPRTPKPAPKKKRKRAG